MAVLVGLAYVVYGLVFLGTLLIRRTGDLGVGLIATPALIAMGTLVMLGLLPLGGALGGIVGGSLVVVFFAWLRRLPPATPPAPPQQ
jgi:hypothetical protein